jgi:DNA-binding MarR family transcriptional regulator
MPSTKTLRVNDVPPSKPPESAGMLAREHVAVLLTNVGGRLHRGASAYYRAAWDLGMTEWRLLAVLNSTESLNVGELSDAADLDKAAVSRSLVLLQERKLISVEQTRTRGRAAIAKLTAEGRELSEKLLQISREREARLFKNFSHADKECLNLLLQRLTQALAGADWDH